MTDTQQTNAALIAEARAWANSGMPGLESQYRVNRLITALTTEREKVAALEEANGILEDALQEVGDDYPGSSCQEWCQQQVKAARAVLLEARARVEPAAHPAHRHVTDKGNVCEVPDGVECPFCRIAAAHKQED